MSFILKTVDEICLELAHRLKSVRLEENLSQEGLASRSGVSLGSLKRFESQGKVSLESFIKIILSLDLRDELEDLFMVKYSKVNSIHKLINDHKSPQRGRLK